VSKREENEVRVWEKEMGSKEAEFYLLKI